MSRLLNGGRYVIGKRLGIGGMGIVYEAEDLVRVEHVAVKLLHSDHQRDGATTGHMERELRVGRAVHHRNVVAIYDGGCEGDRPFVVMELVRGRMLGIAEGEHRLSVRRAADIVEQILAGVGAIHRAGFVHGDLKSDNVLVAAGDVFDVVKIIDLGLAHERDAARLPIEESGGPRSHVQNEQCTASDEATCVISGTPDYVAPEVVLGGVKTVASELYAVGVILYELITGSTPFGGGPVVEILRRQVEAAVMPPSLRVPGLRLSLALEGVVLRALAKCPDARFGDAAEFIAALRAAMRVSVDDSLITPRGSSTSAPTTGWTRPALPGLSSRSAPDRRHRARPLASRGSSSRARWAPRTRTSRRIACPPHRSSSRARSGSSMATRPVRSARGGCCSRSPRSAMDCTNRDARVASLAWRSITRSADTPTSADGARRY